MHEMKGEREGRATERVCERDGGGEKERQKSRERESKRDFVNLQSDEGSWLPASPSLRQLS